MKELRLAGVSHAFDGHAVLHTVELVVPANRLVCLLGPSGCGKTTLLRVIAGLETLQTGTIAVGNEAVADARGGLHLPPERRGVGMMFQDYALFPHLTVFENILFGVPRGHAERRAWAREALGHMGLAAYDSAYPHVLSGGQQQRVALLRALAPEPAILLLDEPFSGLDVTLRAQVRGETLAFLKRAGQTALMVTHDPEEAMFMADEMLIMAAGRIVQVGAPADIYLKPRSAFVATLFGPMNRLRGTVRQGSVETPLGRFPAPGLADGAAADVLVRPEGLRPTAATGVSYGQDWRPCPASLVVVEAHLLGRSSQLRMRIAAADGEVGLQARVPGIYLPPTSTEVPFSVDERQAFVFPAD